MTGCGWRHNRGAVHLLPPSTERFASPLAPAELLRRLAFRTAIVQQHGRWATSVSVRPEHHFQGQLFADHFVIRRVSWDIAAEYSDSLSAANFRPTYFGTLRPTASGTELEIRIALVRLPVWGLLLVIGVLLFISLLNPESASPLTLSSPIKFLGKMLLWAAIFWLAARIYARLESSSIRRELVDLLSLTRVN